jgi:hypothetical protein
MLLYIYSEVLRKKKDVSPLQEIRADVSVACKEGRVNYENKRDTAAKIRFNYILEQLKCPERT